MYYDSSINDVTVAFFYAANEWKTRFETQREMNQQLEKEIDLLLEKIEDANRTYKESKYLNVWTVIL